jgi:hypothetical protein
VRGSLLFFRLYSSKASMFLALNAQTGATVDRDYFSTGRKLTLEKAVRKPWTNKVPIEN